MPHHLHHILLLVHVKLLIIDIKQGSLPNIYKIECQLSPARFCKYLEKNSNKWDHIID